MKKVILSLLLGSALCCFSQSSVVWPENWYRADKIKQSDTLWYNQNGHHHARIQQGAPFPDTALFNYNKCLLFHAQESAFTIPLTSFSSDITVMIAYQTDDTLHERGLWAFSANDKRIGLSTQQIFGEQTVIRYNNVNRTDAIVNTVSQSWKQGDFVPDMLYIGGTDSISFHGKLGEIVLFDRRINSTELLQWQSYLAVKHGITLYKLNYLNAKGDTVWHYDSHPAYYSAVSGLGCDMTFGLHQKQSLMDNRLSIGVGEIAQSNALNNSVIPDGNFLLWGSDPDLFQNPQTTYLQNGEELLTYGNCLIEATGNTIRSLPTSIQIDVSKWEGVNMNDCVLLIDRNHDGDFSKNSVELHFPTHIDTNGIVTFSNILWDTDYSGSDLFRFGFYPANNDEHASNKSLTTTNTNTESNSPGADNNPAINHSNSYNLYPNPSSGIYNLSIRLSSASDIVIRILSPEGKLLETKEGKGQKDYHFTGSVQTQGHYLIEIENALEQKTLKLIKN